jgi:hypothetical protein
MPVRIRRHPAHPSPASPYYKFGFQAPPYAFNWYGGSGGVPLNARAAAERGLGCAPCSMGNADILESDPSFAHQYPALQRTVLHRRAPSVALGAIGGDVRRIGRGRRWQGRSRLTQPWPTDGIVSGVTGIVGNVVGAVTHGTRRAMKSISDLMPKAKSKAARGAVSDWPLVIQSGPEPMVYPGEMGAIPVVDDIATMLTPVLGSAATPVAIGGLAIGGYFLVKALTGSRRNPSRRRRRRRSRR